jgi:UDP-N-acetylmuramoyl-tripeptide--D-alanyl-D-alanine ligase
LTALKAGEKMDRILLSQLTDGFAHIKKDCYIDNVASDSRNVKENGVFLAIRGEHVNGEDFAKTAIEKGAKFVITENHIKNIPFDMQAIVPSVLDACVQMGANFRKNYKAKVIAVTGSVGKTTTKDFVYTALSPLAKTVKTLENHNNELGFSETMYSLSKQDEYAVLEMGMEAFGDVHKLSCAAKPAAAIITCVGISHLERMGSRENILKAKMEITDGMSQGGILVLNGDDDLLSKADVPKELKTFYFGIENRNSDARAVDIERIGRSMSFKIEDREFGKIQCKIPAVGRANVMDALSAYLLLTRMGFDPKKIAENLNMYTPSGMRQNFVDKNGILFIEDCYNAAPDSMRAAIDTTVSLAKARKIAVLGNMYELGPDSAKLHRQIGEYAKEKGIDAMLTLGDMAAEISKGFKDGAIHFQDRKKLCEYIVSHLKKNDTILFKASHSMRFEDIIDCVYKKLEKGKTENV